MVKFLLNSKEVECAEGLSIIQACEGLGVEIPRFCYHDRLKVAGNCRMCLVEVEKMPKPVASCAMPVTEGMSIKTDSTLVKKARSGVMEFLLINHPLDCPICDEGGECDLQDQAMKYGLGTNRFTENKRAVPKKHMGPLIKTEMNRCIHCTRCIRFASDVAGIEEIGAVGRGEDMEITTLEKAISSELSGNVIDICPVGALTSKPYAFKARSWELSKTESIDVLDAVGSNIRIDSRNGEVMRILPCLNEDINEEWISDKTRFSYDGLKVQRIDKAYIKEEGKFKVVSVEKALEIIAKKMKRLKKNELAAVTGQLVDVESIKILKDIVQSDYMDPMPNGIVFDKQNRQSYLFNTSIAGIEKSDFCLLIGTNPRIEATIVNARIKKRSLMSDYAVYSIADESPNLTYPVNHLGGDSKILDQILSGKHVASKALKAAKYPIIIVGYGAFLRNDSDALLDIISKIVTKYEIIRNDWNGFNVLHQYASIVGALDIGFAPKNKTYNIESILKGTHNGKIKMLYALGADEIDVKQIAGSAFVVYQGHHGSELAQRADVILPAAAYTEKDGLYANLEGRYQTARKAVAPPADALDDFETLSHLARKLKIKLAYKSKLELRQKLVDYGVHTTSWKAIGKPGDVSDESIKAQKFNYYMTNSISRASKIMAKCVEEILESTC